VWGNGRPSGADRHFSARSIDEGLTVSDDPPFARIGEPSIGSLFVIGTQ
jgi:hypothetical protein